MSEWVSGGKMPESSDVELMVRGVGDEDRDDGVASTKDMVASGCGCRAEEFVTWVQTEMWRQVRAFFPWGVAHFPKRACKYDSIVF